LYFWQPEFIVSSFSCYSDLVCHNAHAISLNHYPRVISNKKIDFSLLKPLDRERSLPEYGNNQKGYKIIFKQSLFISMIGFLLHGGG